MGSKVLKKAGKKNWVEGSEKTPPAMASGTGTHIEYTKAYGIAFAPGHSNAHASHAHTRLLGEPSAVLVGRMVRRSSAFSRSNSSWVMRPSL